MKCSTFYFPTSRKQAKNVIERGRKFEVVFLGQISAVEEGVSGGAGKIEGTFHHHDEGEAAAQ